MKYSVSGAWNINYRPKGKKKNQQTDGHDNKNITDFCRAGELSRAFVSGEAIQAEIYDCKFSVIR